MVETNTDYLTAKGLAQSIGVQESTILKYAKDEKLSSSHVGDFGELYFDKSEAEAFKRKRQTSKEKSVKTFKGKTTVAYNEEEKEIVQKWKVSKYDSASADVQIGLLSDKIQRLEGELKEYPCDHINFVLLRARLVSAVGDRRKKLEFLKKTATNRYYKALERLDLCI